MTFTKKIRAIMYRRNISQDNLAQQMGMTQTAISNYLKEGHENTIKLSKAADMARVLGVSLDWLYDANAPLLTDEELDAVKVIQRLIGLLGPELSYKRLALATDVPPTASRPEDARPSPAGSWKPVSER
jgi:transcriptional regulator with XRE-family HTH domain